MSILAILDLAEAQGILVGLSEFGQITIDTSRSGLSKEDAFVWSAQIYRFYTEVNACLRDTVKQRARNDMARAQTKVWMTYLADQAKANPMVRKS